MTIELAVCLVILTIVGGLAAAWLDWRAWNGGICRESGLPWQFRDMDSQGGRLYDDGEGNSCWISWPIGDRKGQ